MRRTLLLPGIAVCAIGCGSVPRHSTDALSLHARQWQRIAAGEDARGRTRDQLDAILSGLASESPELNILSLRALGRLERPELLPHMVPLLHSSPHAFVRAAAAQAVAQSARSARSTDAHIAALLRRLEDAPSDLVLVAEPLGRIAHPSLEQSTVIVTALVTGYDAWLRNPAGVPDADELRLALTRGLYFVARQPSRRAAFVSGALELLRSIASTGGGGAVNARARSLALGTLGALAAADETTVRAALDDPVELVRRDAIAAIGTHADTAVVRHVITDALGDASPMVRYESVRVYGRRLAASHGCGPVVTATRDAGMHVELLAIDLLGTSCRDAAHAALLDSIAVALPRTESAAWHAPVHALVALARVTPERARQRLAAFAAHPSFFVRTYAAQAAAVLGDTALLVRHAADAHANVRSAAVQALSRSAGHTADSIYLEQLSRNDSELIMVAAAALAQSPHPRAPDALLAALDRITALQQETARDARVALLTRIRELGSAAHAPRMAVYTRDFDAVVADTAASIIGAWTGTRPAVAPAPLPRSPLPSWDEMRRLERSTYVIELDDGRRFDVRLLPFIAPTNAARFARLVERGYYDGLTLHRVVPNFVVQGGSPGANEYSGDGPYTRDEVGASNWRGTVGLSTRGRDTGDAQFYINLVDNVRLDHDYTVFGVVTRGMDAVAALQEGARIRRIRVNR